jgi:hypothetical protein
VAEVRRVMEVGPASLADGKKQTGRRKENEEMTCCRFSSCEKNRNSKERRKANWALSLTRYMISSSFKIKETQKIEGGIEKEIARKHW